MLNRIPAYLAGLAAALTLTFAAAQAQTKYPTKPMTLVVAFTPGGPSDVLARIVGKKLQEMLGQPFIIENRPGAGGNIAAEQVARADRDGYTLLMGNNSILATNAALYNKVNFDPEKDFVPISLVGTQANILVVNPNVPVKTMAELIALAKSKPGQLNFALLRPRRGGASVGRAVQGRGQGRYRARRLQGRGARLAGRHRRTRPDDVRDRGLGRRPHQE